MSEEIVLEFPDNTVLPILFGEYNRHITYIEKKLGIEISDRGNILHLFGDTKIIAKAESVLKSLALKLKTEELDNVTRADIDTELRFLAGTNDKPNADIKVKKKTRPMNEGSSHSIIKTKNKTIAPRSPNQQNYLDLINSNDMVFGLGPAGTGKTYLSVAAGVSMFLKGEVERLVFCRPAVEAGESLGFLPGDMKEKIDPYLRPIYDALQDMLPLDFLVKKMETGEIEIAPLAFMRGRTLARSFVILDEAQNATSVQMKMFLTRMGEASRMVITGDASQSDLPSHVNSGLDEAIQILQNVEGIGFIEFDASDVIRHSLVRKIINAYDNFARSKNK